MQEALRIVGVAFGNPMGCMTFSGYSRHLFSAIRDLGNLDGTVSARILRPRDLFDGCVVASRGSRMLRPRLNLRWVWRPKTVEILSNRLDKRMARLGPGRIMLQVGTHVYPLRPEVRHFCVTDMTVAEAGRGRMFGIGSLTKRELSEAEQVQRRIFDSCDKIFVLSSWIRESLVRDCGQNAEKIVVAGAGANIHPLESAPQKYASKNILFVAREWETKGGPLLAEAFEIVRRTHPDATLTIVGPRPVIKRRGVTTTGPLRRNRPREYDRLMSAYRNAACFCLLSEFDAFPNVILEAQYCGTPVVALDRQSRREAVVPGETGLLVREARPEQVAEALSTILGNPDLARAMGDRARSFIAHKFTWAVVAQRIVDEIRSACRGYKRESSHRLAADS